MITQAEGVRSLPDCRAPDPGAQLHHLAAVGNGVPQRRGDTVTTKRQPEASMTKKRYFIKLFLFHARHRNIYTCFFENKSRGRYRTLRFPLAMQEKSARIGDAWANWFIG